jgi:hypothetical protein
MPDALIPELAEYQRHFRANRGEAQRLCRDLGTPQFNWRPAVDRWSIGECLMHLNVSARVFSAAIEAAIDRGRAHGQVAAGPFRYGPFTRWLNRSLEPPIRIRYRSPRLFYPPSGIEYEVAATLDVFTAAERRWEDCLSRANGLDLARVKVPSPALPMLRFSLGAVFAGQATHERRHLWQAQQVRAEPGFPTN